MQAMLEEYKADLISRGFSEIIIKIKVESFLESYKKGFVKGEVKILIRTLFLCFGSPSESLMNRICAIADISKLERLYDIAFYCESMDDFERAMESL
ncbi:MAG: hypothetical protein LBU65_16205 [Planctomycetaceae bacterium]|jgi:hypothetical protein|nr:hypothetical protein [Planctomycetaceae bacterium]